MWPAHAIGRRRVHAHVWQSGGVWVWPAHAIGRRRVHAHVWQSGVSRPRVAVWRVAPTPSHERADGVDAMRTGSLWYGPLFGSAWRKEVCARVRLVWPEPVRARVRLVWPEPVRARVRLVWPEPVRARVRLV